MSSKKCRDGSDHEPYEPSTATVGKDSTPPPAAATAAATAVGDRSEVGYDVGRQSVKLTRDESRDDAAERRQSSNERRRSAEQRTTSASDDVQTPTSSATAVPLQSCLYASLRRQHAS